MIDNVECIGGGIAVDDRGHLQFCNNFDMQGICRFYIVSNHAPQFVRAWHAHKKETKCVFVVSGAAIIAAVKIENWEHPDKNASVERFVLSEKDPKIVKIPAGYANGFKTLVPDTKVMFFSTTSIKESQGDDYRYKADYWDPWYVEPR